MFVEPGIFIAGKPLRLKLKVTYEAVAFGSGTVDNGMHTAADAVDVD